MRAGDDLDQRRLASTVFAEQCVDLTRQQLKRHTLQRAHGTEGFADVRELEEGFQDAWVRKAANLTKPC